MKKHLALISSFLLLLLTLSGCTRSQEDAQAELQKKRIPFTEQVFLNYLRKGDKDTVLLFIDAGVDPNLMVDVREAGYPTPPEIYEAVPKIPILLMAIEQEDIELEKALIKAGASEEIAIDFANKYSEAELAYKKKIELEVEKRLSLPALTFP